MSNKRHHILPILILCFAVLFLFLHLDDRSLWDPDEGRYAEMAREILVLHDWITPHLNYLLYFEKPMLFMWLTAFSFKAFGFTETAARLTPFLSALGTLLLISLMATKLWGKRAGIVAALSLFTSIEFFILAQAVDINMPLTLFITATFVFFWFGHTEHKAGYYFLAWACAGLAVLTKGPVGIILPAGGILLYLISTRQIIGMWKAKPISGVLIFLAVTVPWYFLVSIRNPDFFSFFFIDQNLLRYTTVQHERFQPWWFFVPVIIGGFLPWSILIPQAIRDAFKDGYRHIPNEIWYIAAWFLFIFLFFLPSHSKIVTYVLPCFPPLSLFIGNLFKDTIQKGRAYLSILAGIWAILGIGLILFPHLVDAGTVTSTLEDLGPLLGIASTMGLIILVMTAIGFLIGKKIDTVNGVAILGLSLMVVATVFSPRWDNLHSTKELMKNVPDNVKVYAFVRYYQSSSFYAERKVVLVDYDHRGELIFGKERDTDHSLSITQEEFYVLMQKERDVYCIALERYFADIQKNVPGIQKLAQVNEFCLLGFPLQFASGDAERCIKATGSVQKN